MILSDDEALDCCARPENHWNLPGFESAVWFLATCWRVARGCRIVGTCRQLDADLCIPGSIRIRWQYEFALGALQPAWSRWDIDSKHGPHLLPATRLEDFLEVEMCGWADEEVPFGFMWGKHLEASSLASALNGARKPTLEELRQCGCEGLSAAIAYNYERPGTLVAFVEASKADLWRETAADVERVFANLPEPGAGPESITGRFDLLRSRLFPGAS